MGETTNPSIELQPVRKAGESSRHGMGDWALPQAIKKKNNHYDDLTDPGKKTWDTFHSLITGDSKERMHFVAAGKHPDVGAGKFQQLYDGRWELRLDGGKRAVFNGNTKTGYISDIQLGVHVR